MSVNEDFEKLVKECRQSDLGQQFGMAPPQHIMDMLDERTRRYFEDLDSKVIDGNQNGDDQCKNS